MNKLLIHIGMPKTASTSIEQFLFTNSGLLKKYGWAYPQIKLDEMDSLFSPVINGHVFRGFARTNGWTLQKRELWDKAINQLSEELQSNNVIVSSEFFWYENCFDVLERLAAQKYDNCKVAVCVYLRRQDLWIESIWNQLVKQNDCTLDLLQFSETMACELEYLKKLESLADIIGAENIVVRIFEKERLYEGDAVKDFGISVLGIPAYEFDSIQIPHENERFDGNIVEIKRHFNRSLQNCENVDVFEYYKLFKSLCANIKSEKGSYFTHEERVDMMKLFDEDNARIGRIFMGTDDKNIFGELKEIKYIKPEVSGIEEDIIQIFAEYVKKTSRELKFVKKELLEHKLENRKLALYGAGNECRKKIALIDEPVECIFDSYIDSGIQIGGIPVVGADKVADWHDYFVLITPISYQGIVDRLEREGLKRGKDFALLEEYF